MTVTTATTATIEAREPSRAELWLYRLGVPLLAVFTALLIGAIAMWATGSDPLVAYKGLIDGAFLKPRAFGETLVATTPYLLLALGVGVGFKCGLFNIGVEGQYDIGQLAAVWVATNLVGLPLLHPPAPGNPGRHSGGWILGCEPGFPEGALRSPRGDRDHHDELDRVLLADYLVGLKGPIRAIPGPACRRAARSWHLPNCLGSMSCPRSWSTLRRELCWRCCWGSASTCCCA